jgi:putative endonuclease
MFFVYILKSKKNGAYYIGYASNIKCRLAKHNSGTVLSAKNKGPWEVYYSEIFDDETSAIRRERQLKSWKSRKAIEKLKF